MGNQEFNKLLDVYADYEERFENDPDGADDWLEGTGFTYDDILFAGAVIDAEDGIPDVGVFQSGGTGGNWPDIHDLCKKYGVEKVRVDPTDLFDEDALQRFVQAVLDDDLWNSRGEFGIDLSQFSDPEAWGPDMTVVLDVL